MKVYFEHMKHLIIVSDEKKALIEYKEELEQLEYRLQKVRNTAQSCEAGGQTFFAKVMLSVLDDWMYETWELAAMCSEYAELYGDSRADYILEGEGN